jgi:hypothetical protein
LQQFRTKKAGREVNEGVERLLYPLTQNIVVEAL